MPDPCPKPALDASKRGKRSKRKGARLEVEWAKRIGGEVVRYSGARGGEKDSNDVIQTELGNDWRYEVKGGGQVPTTPYKWLQRETNCGVDTVKYTEAATPITEGGRGRMRPPQALAYRDDNSNWLVVIPEDEWRLLLNLFANAKREAERGWIPRAIEYLSKLGRGA